MSQKPLRQYQVVTFSDDEDWVTVGAESFKAADGPMGRCDGCAMKNGFGCDLWRNKGSTRCQPGDRKDGRSVVWVGAAA